MLVEGQAGCDREGTARKVQSCLLSRSQHCSNLGQHVWNLECNRQSCVFDPYASGQEYIPEQLHMREHETRPPAVVAGLQADSVQCLHRAKKK